MDGDGPAIWRRACQLGLEGIVSKRAESKYASGLVYAGKLERGFSEEDKRTIHKRLAPLMCASSR